MGMLFIKKYLKYIIGSGILILFILVIGFFARKNIMFLENQQNKIDLTPASVTFISGTPSQSNQQKPFDFKGTLYFALAELGGPHALGLYSFDISRKTEEKPKIILASEMDKAGEYYQNLSPSVSSDGQELVFSRKKHSDPALQIFISDLDGKNLKQITSSDDPYKREPIFSPSGGLIAYISKNANAPAGDIYSPKIEIWTTYLTDLNGHSVKVADGANPIFSPDEKKLLVLQNDGLHAFDISSWENPRALGLVAKTLEGGVSYAMKIGVSADGKTMAWSSPAKNEVLVSKINSWDNFSISPLIIIKTRAYWSVFSSDGKYLALDEWRKDKTGNEHAVIMGYDLASGQSKNIITLVKYDKGELWFGGWK
jgi:hypothetical protein